MSKEMEEGKIFAFLAYLLSIIGFLIVLLAKKDNKFAMYHAKQSLVLFIVYMIGWVILVFIPFLGWGLLPVWWVIMVIMTIIGIINAVTGKEKPLPIIGKYAKKIKI
ncbi:DUF4870 domain-containing protein [Candidatus Woesearchaeota archaeon]|nr:DUF4870 domain-containing protein [Candidatus Woesearchaeota archaeon]